MKNITERQGKSGRKHNLGPESSDIATNEPTLSTKIKPSE